MTVALLTLASAFLVVQAVALVEGSKLRVGQELPAKATTVAAGITPAPVTLAAAVAAVLVQQEKTQQASH